MKSKILVAALFGVAGALSAAGGASFLCEGSVEEECVVAVPLNPAVFVAAAQAAPGDAAGVARMLRVTRGDGGSANVPYVLRPQLERRVRMVDEWHGFTVASANLDGGKLTCSFTQSMTNGAAWVALEVGTPLRDFEQLVTVKDADGREIATDVLYDYTKFADVRKTVIRFPAAASPFTVVFSTPETEVESALFNRLLEKNAEGALTTKSESRTVERRPFRVDGVRSALPREEISFKPVRPRDVMRPCRVEESGNRTVITCDTAYMPLSCARLRPRSDNFSRKVAVEFYADHEWRPLRKAGVRSVNLPGERSSSLEIPLDPNVRHAAIRLLIDNDDNPPLSFSDSPVVFGFQPIDVLFIAQPQAGPYALALDEKSAAVPKYDDMIRSYIDKVRDPVRWSLKVDGRATEAALPEESWAMDFLRRHGVGCASAIVFVVLLLACIKLLKK